MKNLLNVESAERVDLRDFLYAFDESIQDTHRELLGQLMLNPASPGGFKVLSGFTMTNPSGKILQVTRGVGLLGQREGVNAYSAALSSSGSTTKAVDLASFPPGNYGVFIRFELEETDSATRAFWDPSGGGAEYQQSIPTRRSANWSLRVESTMPPGGEWLRIGTVAQATMVITDERPLFFEGQPSAAYASGWSTDGGGVANDRNANRSLYGVTNFAQFSNAMRQCLEDIKGRGLRRWWDRDIGGMNLGFDAAPVEDRLAVGSADFYLGWENAGDDRYLKFDGTNGWWFHYNDSGNIMTLRVQGTDTWVWTGDGKFTGTRSLATGYLYDVQNTSSGGAIRGRCTSGAGVEGEGLDKGVIGSATGSGGYGGDFYGQVAGVKGTGQGTVADGGQFFAATTGTGVDGTGGGSGSGAVGRGGSTGDGVIGIPGASGGVGVWAQQNNSVRGAFLMDTQAQPSGPSVIGEMYVTTAGVLKICTAAGTPGTWVSVGTQT